MGIIIDLCSNKFIIIKTSSEKEYCYFSQQSLIFYDTNVLI